MENISIQARHLTKRFKTYKKPPGLKGSFQSLFARKHTIVTAVNDISFDIPAGEIVGFIGQNGAGKTTTLKMLSGLLHPSEGSAHVLGHTPWERKSDFLRQFTLIMGQKNQLWWDLPAMDTFELNRQIFNISDEDFHHTVTELSQLLAVEDVLHVQVRKLSLGQRMKCELISSLLHQPKVLLLDEPTIGLDVVMQKILRDAIRAYNKKYHATIILTSHYMNDVKELCKRIIMIEHGQKVYDGTLDGVIDKYAHSKRLKLIFSKPVSKSELATLGTITEYEEDGTSSTVTISVNRNHAASLAAKALKEFPVEDISIEEAPIEAVIRDLFADQQRPATNN